MTVLNPNTVHLGPLEIGPKTSNRRRLWIAIAICVLALLSFGATLLCTLPLLLAQIIGGARPAKLLSGHRVQLFGEQKLASYWPDLAKSAVCLVLAIISLSMHLPSFIALIVVLGAAFFLNRFLWYWLAPGARPFLVIAHNIYDKRSHIVVIGGSTFNTRAEVIITPSDLVDVSFRASTMQRWFGLSELYLSFYQDSTLVHLQLHSPGEPDEVQRATTYLMTQFRSGLMLKRGDQ